MSTALTLQEELQRNRESTPENSPKLVDPLCQLAKWYCEHRQPHLARPLIQEIWKINRHVYGRVHEHSVDALSWLATILVSSGRSDRAETLLADLVVRLRTDQFLPLHRRAAIWNQLVEIYFGRSKLAEAIQFCREVMELLHDRQLPEDVRNSPECLLQLNRARNNLGALHVSLGEFMEAEQAFIMNLKDTQRRHPDDLLAIGHLLSNLAVVARLRGFVDKSQRLTILAIRKCERVAGKVHPLVAQGLSNLALYRLQDGRLTSALSLFRKALKIRRQLHPSNHHHVIRSMQQLADAHLALRNHTCAERLLKQTRIRLERRTPIDELQLARTLCGLGHAYLQVGQIGSSLQVLEQAYQIQEKILGPTNLQMIPTLNGLGKVDAARGNLESAHNLFRRSLEIAEENLGPNHPDLAKMLIWLGEISLERGDLGEAQTLIGRALSLRGSRLGAGHPLVAEVLVKCGQIALAEDKPNRALSISARAKRMLQEALEHPPLTLADILAIEAEASNRLQMHRKSEVASQLELQLREKIVGTGHATLLPAIKRLSALYMEQQSLEKAGPLLRRGLSIAENCIPNRDERCIYFAEKIGQLSLARQEFDEAGQWMERAVKMLQRRYGDDANEAADALLRFACHLRTAGRETDAEVFELRAIDMRNRNCHVLL